MSSKTIDQQFIEYVVQSLVSKPDEVIVERKIDEKGVLLTLTVDPEDLGRVIGKRGATAQSLRTLLRALGTKQEARFNLKIVDNGVPKPEREASNNEGSGWSTARTSSSDDADSDESNDENSSEEFGADDSEQNSEENINSEDITSIDTDDDEDDDDDESTTARTRRELEDLDDLDV